MPFDLGHFSLGDMLRCGLGVRRVARDAPTMESAARAISRYLYDECIDPHTGERSCALVRCYKTQSYSTLDPSLQAFARRQLGGEPPSSDMRCLTLLATVGDDPRWNSRADSRGHRAIPLPSVELVAKAPMIAQLIRDFGLDIADVIRPVPDVTGDPAGKTYNVFHVEEASGSPHIPAQDEFVRPYGLRSVVGFGGVLATGDLFAIILFSRTPIPPSSAERFRAIALDVSVLFHLREQRVFDAPPPRLDLEGPGGGSFTDPGVRPPPP